MKMDKKLEDIQEEIQAAVDEAYMRGMDDASDISFKEGYDKAVQDNKECCDCNCEIPNGVTLTATTFENVRNTAYKSGYTQALFDTTMEIERLKF